MVNFKEVEQGIFKEIENKGIKVDEWDLKKIFEDCKNKFINEQVEQLNIFLIENHDLNNNYSEIRKKLYGINDSEKIKQTIKDYFSKFSKDDRIRQLLDKLPLDVTKILNKGNDRFYSLYDISKDYNKEQAIKQLKESCKKEILISCYLKDSYRVSEQLRYLQQLLSLLFSIEITFTYACNRSLKDYESEINNSTKDIKVRLFSEWLYISFKNDEQRQKLLNLMIGKRIPQIYKEG